MIPSSYQYNLGFDIDMPYDIQNQLLLNLVKGDININNKFITTYINIDKKKYWCVLSSRQLDIYNINKDNTLELLLFYNTDNLAEVIKEYYL